MLYFYGVQFIKSFFSADCEESFYNNSWFEFLFFYMLLILSKYVYFKSFLAISYRRHLHINLIVMWFWTKFLDHFPEENAKKVTFPRPSQTKLYMFWNQHEKCHNLSYGLHCTNIYNLEFGFSPCLAVNSHFYFAHISIIVSFWNFSIMRHQSAFKILLVDPVWSHSERFDFLLTKLIVEYLLLSIFWHAYLFLFAE